MRVGVGYKLKYLLALSVVCIFFANCFICPPPLPRQIAGHICCKMTSTGAGYCGCCVAWCCLCRSLAATERWTQGWAPARRSWSPSPTRQLIIQHLIQHNTKTQHSEVVYEEYKFCSNISNCIRIYAPFSFIIISILSCETWCVLNGHITQEQRRKVELNLWLLYVIYLTI